MMLILSFLFFLPIALVIVSNYSIKSSAKNKTFFDVSRIKKNKVGLVLGTSKNIGDGSVNLYFQYRIDATVMLFKKGKIDFVLVSGDNGNENYDEPTDFKDELIKRGVPKDKIFLDYAGFRTLDSVVRAKAIFGLGHFTVISQKFHNERAIYLAGHKGINAVGFNAQDPPNHYGMKTTIREYFARTKAILDVVLGVSPRYLGAEIKIE
ncbi:vancomycin high temperature exclusion protein [Mariniflexile ostreae]|uniref:Vancomycin high temperature exclusion protein n=2 Tax=Mariniflexile ostreae TaxID=1520892 RepID=A0ABV5F7J1_9FLAO